MTINTLCVGNIVSLAYNPEVITTVMFVEVGGSVQVACNNYADDIRDIVGIPLNSDVLKRFSIPVKVVGDKAELYIIYKKNKVFVSAEAKGTGVELEYLHELQNFVSSLTGISIIDHKKFRI